MRRLVIIASVAVLAIAKPEMYKETEDFQYSRSSSDDGTKSGYYGARRGNMGGNFERAHNMDGLAQHQMSSAVRQVEGELGEGANMRTGSVYTSANSRGIYGSGNYDLSNLKGRNFAESGSFDSSHSSLTSQNSGFRDHSYSAAQNSGYSGFTKSARHSSGHQSADYLGQYARNENAHIQDAQQAANQYSYGKQEASGSQYEYHSHSGSQAQNQYDSSKSNLQHAYDSNVYSRHDMPVRVVVRPGSTIRVPITANAQDISSYKDASYNKNSINSEAEVLDNNDQQFYISSVNKPKHYESSYSYRKEWEKHHTQPVTVLPTENPFPKNSELYDDSHLLQNAKSQYNVLDASNVESNSANVARSNSYTAHTKSSSFNKSGYRAESQSQGVSAGALSNAYTLGGQNTQQTADVNNLVDDINSKPKSYQSSYSYHKSWERRGDPYVIKPLSPVGGDVAGQTSQRLVSASANQGAFSSHHYGSRYNQAQSVYSHDGVDCDCDENGHIRIARSADEIERFHDLGQQEQNKWEDLGQQTQNKWEDLGQQTQEFGQLTQNKWADLGQQTQNKWDDLRQQTQSKWEDLGQQTQDFGQLTQNKWIDLGQQTQNKWKDLGQQTQKKWDDLRQQTESKWEDLGQQTQEFGQLTQNKWEDLGQQTQDFGQLTQNRWEDLGQQTQDLGKLTHNKWDKLETLGQETQNQWTNSQDNESQKDKLETFGQQTQNKYDQFDIGQKVNNNWDGQQNYDQHTFMGGLSQQSQDNKFEHFLEQTEDNISGFNQYTTRDKHDKQRQDEHIFIPSSPFDQSTDKNGYIQNKDEGYFDQQNKDDSISTHSFAYNHNLNNNKEAADNMDDLSELDNDDLLSLLIQDHFKNFNSKLTPDKWEHTDTDNDKQRNIDVSKSEYPYSTSQNFEEKLSQSQWHHSSSEIDESKSHFITNIDTKSSTTEKSLKETTPISILSQKPTRFPSSTTTMKPKYHHVSNLVPAGPIDIGRGDIGAEEGLSESDEKDIVNTHIFNILGDRKPNKTPEEVESLSMTVQDQKHSTDYKAHEESQAFDDKEFIGKIDNSDKLHHENTNSNSFEPENSSYTTLKNSLSTDNDQHTYHVSHSKQDFNKDNPSAQNVKPGTDTSTKKSSQNGDWYDKDNTSNFDVQQNTDQQFEDFSQSIQSSMDLGQQVQSSWQPNDDFVQHDVQQLENFGNLKKNIFDSDHSHVESSDQQLQQFGRENLQEYQKFADIEKEMSWKQSYSQYGSDNKLHKPKENIISEDLTSRNTPVLENFDVKEKVEPQKPIAQEEAIVTPIEVTTEKQGFWKSVGNKFSKAKDTVASWFKG